MYLLSTLAYLARDSVPPRWDSAGHLYNALHYRDLLAEGGLLRFLFKHYAYYPPLVYQVTGLLHLVFGRGPGVAYGVTQAYALVLLLATYRLGRAVASPAAGLLAGACVLLLPIVTVFARDFLLEVPLAASFAVALVLAVERPLRSARRAALLGAVIGMGLLTKWTFALAMAAPLACVAWSALSRRESRPTDAPRLALCLGLAAALAGPWYAWNLSPFLAEARRTAITTAALEHDPAFGSARYFLYYAGSLLRDSFYLPLFLALLAGGVLAARRERRLRRLFGVTVGPYYLWITLIPNKDPRYVFPLLPVLAVALAAGVAAIERTRLRRVLGVALCGGLAVQHAAGLVDLGRLSARTVACTPGLRLRAYDPADPPVYFLPREPPAPGCRWEWTLFNPFSYFGHLPRREDWLTDPIVACLPDGARVWGQLEDDVHLSQPLVVYAARRMGREVVFVSPPARATRLLWKGALVPGQALPFVRAPCRLFVLPDESRVHVCPASGRPASTRRTP